MYSIWCEWDIGVEGKIFSEVWVAVRHARANLEACNIDESFEELKDEGLIGIDKVEVFYE